MSTLITSSTSSILGGLLSHTLRYKSLYIASLVISFLMLAIIRLGRHHRSQECVPISDYEACLKGPQYQQLSGQKMGHLKQPDNGFAQQPETPNTSASQTPLSNIGDRYLTPVWTTNAPRYSYPIQCLPNVPQLATRTTYTRRISTSDESRHPEFIVRGELLQTKLSRRHIKTYEPLGATSEIMVA